ncbi:MAG: mannosyltransferase [Microbacteriaceae bacterium]|nr:mannosyltransferase [Microbacteriaceae bacterium]
MRGSTGGSTDLGLPMTTAYAPAVAVPHAPAAPRGVRRYGDAIAIGVAATLISAAWSWVPAVWRDEVATIAAATRTWSAFAGPIQQTDVVHALYYAVMHLWFALVGYTPFTLRLPSALAVGATAAAVTILGRSLAGRWVGLASGIVAAVLPSLVWAGGEGRSFAFTALFATLATGALLHALRTTPGRTGWALVAPWVAYGALLALSVAVFVDSLLLGVAHLVTALLLGGRRVLVPLGAALAAAAVVVAPLLIMAAGQTGQISWISSLTWRSTPHQVAVGQWFRTDLVAWVALALVVAGTVLGLIRAGREVSRTGLSVLAVALPWAVLPPLALLVVSLVASPMYVTRYLTFTTPAVALILGLAAAALPRPLTIVALVLLAAVAVPQIVVDRSPRAKDRSDLSLAADLVASARASDPERTPAGIVYGDYHTFGSMTTSVAEIAYPSAFRGLTDLTALRPITSSDTAREPRTTVGAAVPKMRRLNTVWFLLTTDAPPHGLRIPAAKLRGLGFKETGDYHVARVRLVRWSR